MDESRRDDLKISSVRTWVSVSKKSLRVLSAITISSREALPARSPMPLIVHSICRAPARMAASELATAWPRSLWQCTESTALALFLTFSRIFMIRWNHSSGMA